jgi:hypothetical protein
MDNYLNLLEDMVELPDFLKSDQLSWDYLYLKVGYKEKGHDN